jgi:predicted phosphohydrolase
VSYELKITLDNLEEKIIKTIALDPQEWLENFVNYRVEQAKLEIFEREIQRLKESGAEMIPTNVDSVLSSMEIKSALELHEEELEKLSKGPAGIVE